MGRKASWQASRCNNTGSKTDRMLAIQVDRQSDKKRERHRQADSKTYTNIRQLDRQTYGI